MITQHLLKITLHYDADTGVFTWKIVPRYGINIGDKAGSVTAEGYINIGLYGSYYMAHRLAWLYVTGKWPKNQIDHKNTIRSDNSFNNLREATRSINCQNQHKAHIHSKTKILGVSHSGKKFITRIRTNGDEHYLGTFSNASEAEQAYLSAKMTYHKGFYGKNNQVKK